MAREQVRKTYKLYVGGSFPRSESGRSYPVTDTAGHFVANAAQASRKDVRDAVVAARAGWAAWSGATAYNRGQVLFRIAEMMEACAATLGEGSSIMMFPEGTRSSTGEMRPFKPGAFELAIENGHPILPIAIVGSADALPKRGFLLQGTHSIRVTVLEPIPPEQFADLTAPELASHVRELIAAEIARPAAD